MPSRTTTRPSTQPETCHRLLQSRLLLPRKGQHDRAIEDYDQAIKLNPKLAIAFFNRGAAYSDKGQHDRAIQDYDQAIKLDPSDADNFYERSLAKAKKGDTAGADADLAAARRIDPNIGR